jgi:hypothetical protein
VRKKKEKEENSQRRKHQEGDKAVHEIKGRTEPKIDKEIDYFPHWGNGCKWEFKNGNGNRNQTTVNSHVQVVQQHRDNSKHE